MSLGQKVASNTAVITGGRIISSLLGFFSLAILARYLGKESFGEYHIIFVFLNMAAAAADLGLYSILTREISKYPEKEKEIVGGIFGLRIASIILFFGISFVLLYFLPYSFNVKIGAMIASVGFLFMSTTQLLMGIFQKYFQTLWPVIGDVATRVLQLLLIVWAVASDAPFLYFPAISAVCVLAGYLIDLYFAKKIIKFSISFDWNFSKSALKMSWPLAVSSVLTLIYFKMDSFLLSLMKPAGDVGIYSLAYKVFEGLLFFPAAFSGLVLSLFAGSAGTDKFKIFFKKSLNFLIIVALPLSVGGFVLSQKIALLLGGAEFSAASLPIKILMTATFFVFLGNLFGNVIIALDKQKKMVYVYGLGVFISTVFNLIFIPRYSYLATSYVTLLTEAVVNSIMFFIIIKEIKYWPLDGIFLKASFASFIMGASLIYFNFLNWNLFVLILIGAAIYAAALFLFGGITKDELKHLVFNRFVAKNENNI